MNPEQTAPYSLGSSLSDLSLYVCADPESFVRGGPTLTFFFF